MTELCQILYSDEYSSTMAALRSSLEQKAYTEEALELTERALDHLASHYTTWHYRFEIVKTLQKNLFDELDWCEDIALDNQKNYQIWNYRQLLIEEILRQPEMAKDFQPRREFPIMNMMLEQDPKNHHVWSYRKWFVQRFALHSDVAEVAFTERLIEADARNNSAWTHRYFLKFKGEHVSPNVVVEEIDYVKSQIDLCPQNPSTWNYLNGIYTQFHKDVTELKEFCIKHANLETGEVSSSFALEALAKFTVKQQDYDGARRIYASLSEKYDPIRKNYWEFLSSKLAADP